MKYLLLTVYIISLLNCGIAFAVSKEFSVRGINLQNEILAIYHGDFSKVYLKPNDMKLMTLFKNYMYAFGKSCNAYLPSNKVEIIESECSEEEVTRDGWGSEISRQCISWRDIHTGIYADPKIYAASKRQEYNGGMAVLNNIFSGGNPMKMFNDALSVANYAASSRNDMNRLINMNGCNSSKLKQFEQNLYNYIERR